jgi:hypothetical protein
MSLMHMKNVWGGLVVPTIVFALVALVPTDARASTSSSTSAIPFQPSTSAIIGEVRDGRAKTPQTVVPDGLPVVAGATVQVPTLGLTGSTDARGRFAFANVPVHPLPTAAGDYVPVTVVVRKPGLGVWTLINTPVYGHGNYLRVYAELTTQDYTEHYVPREERPARPLPTLPTQTGARGSGVGSGGHVASPLANGCDPATNTFTGYHSLVYPPGAIRVLRTATNTVDTVNFLFYVKNVLPNEWIPSTSPEDSLEAGALAIKLYGWWQVNHANGTPPTNGGFAPNGQCYDVDDGIQYQKYVPSSSFGRTDHAVAVRWAAAYLLNGEPVQALYEAGTATCAANSGTSGTRPYGQNMYQNGADYCAGTLGKKWWEIFTTFYLNVGIVWIGSGPAVAAPDTGQRLDVFVLGTDGQIHQKYWDSAGWHPGTGSTWFGATDIGWGTIPGGAVSDPTATWSSHMDRLTVMVRGNDGGLWESHWTAASGWTTWRSLGGNLTAGPSIAAQRSGTRLDVIWRAADTTVVNPDAAGPYLPERYYWDKFDPAVDTDWVYEGPLPQLPVTPDPTPLWDASVSWRDSGATLALYTASNDPGQQVYFASSSGSSWGSWNQGGFGTVSPVPGGVQSKAQFAGKVFSDRGDLLIRGADNRIQSSSFSPTQSAWSSLPGFPASNQVDSGAGATWWQGDIYLDAFVRGADGHLWQQRYDGTSWWTGTNNGWVDVGAYP